MKTKLEDIKKMLPKAKVTGTTDRIEAKIAKVSDIEVLSVLKHVLKNGETFVIAKNMDGYQIEVL